MSKENEFVIFCMESYKQHRSMTGKDVLHLFQEYGVFPYLREFYDVLHTTGHRYINQDIDRFLEERNAGIHGVSPVFAAAVQEDS